jgi:hypothetical protein
MLPRIIWDESTHLICLSCLMRQSNPNRSFDEVPERHKLASNILLRPMRRNTVNL